MSASTGYESPGIAGSGAIATGLAAVSTTHGRHDSARPQRGLGLARRGESRRRLRQDRGGRALAAAGHHRPGRPRRVRRHRRGDRRGGRAKGELLATVAEACPNADLATTTSSLSDRRDRQARRASTAALRPPRLQPGAADEAGRGLLPGRRRRAPARGPAPGARRSARPRSRSPTWPASSSTACSSPTSSTPSASWSRPAWRRARSTPA